MEDIMEMLGLMMVIMIVLGPHMLTTVTIGLLDIMHMVTNTMHHTIMQHQSTLLIHTIFMLIFHFSHLITELWYILMINTMLMLDLNMMTTTMWLQQLMITLMDFGNMIFIQRNILMITMVITTRVTMTTTTMITMMVIMIHTMTTMMDTMAMTLTTTHTMMDMTDMILTTTHTMMDTMDMIHTITLTMTDTMATMTTMMAMMITMNTGHHQYIQIIMIHIKFNLTTLTLSTMTTLTGFQLDMTMNTDSLMDTMDKSGDITHNHGSTMRLIHMTITMAMLTPMLSMRNTEFQTFMLMLVHTTSREIMDMIMVSCIHGVMIVTSMPTIGKTTDSSQISTIMPLIRKITSSFTPTNG